MDNINNFYQFLLKIFFNSKRKTLLSLFIVYSLLKYKNNKHQTYGKYYIETLQDPKNQTNIFKSDILHYKKKQTPQQQENQNNDNIKEFNNINNNSNTPNQFQKIIKKIVSHNAIGNLLSTYSPMNSPLIKKITKQSSQYSRSKNRKNSIKQSLNDLQELETNESNEIFIKKTKKIQKLQQENNYDLTIIFIPGFPGVIKCYDNFLHHLHNEIGQAVDIFAIGYINMANHKDKDYQTYSIQENVRHKTLFLQKLIKENPKRRFIFLAHSLGSYISLRTIQNLPDKLVFKAYLLYPCVNDKFQKTFLAHLGYLAHIFPPTHFLCKIILIILNFLVPRFLLRSVLRTAWISEEMTESIIDLFSLQNLKMINNLYKEAMIHTQQKDDNMFLKSINKCIYYFGKQDNIIPLKSADHLTLKYPKVDCQVNKTGIPHNFSMFHYKQQAKITGSQITEDLDTFFNIMKQFT